MNNLLFNGKLNSKKGVPELNHFPSNLLADLLAEKIKRNNSQLYVDFVAAVNALASSAETIEQLKEKSSELSSFMPYLDLTLSTVNDYEDILNMKATLLDLFVNDLNDRSIYLLVEALKSNNKLTHLQEFIQTMEHWVVVIDSKKRLVTV